PRRGEEGLELGGLPGQEIRAREDRRHRARVGGQRFLQPPRRDLEGAGAGGEPGELGQDPRALLRGELPGEALLQARRGGRWVVARGARRRRRREARERGQRRRVVGRGGERELERVPRPGGVVERALAHLGLAHPERGGLAGRGGGARPLAEEARRLV